MAITGIQLATSLIGLVGNSASAIGASLIVICYMFLLDVNTHFRHHLILNLAVGDAMNGFIGSISQIYRMVTGIYPQPTACTAIGIIVQTSIQSIDVSMFAIAMTTVFAIVRPQWFESIPLLRIRLIVASLWLLPLLTASIAAGLNLYTPATGGWCWIAPKPAYMRYVLTHGWRYVFIVTIMIAYTWLYIHLRKHYKELVTATGGSGMSGTWRRRMHSMLGSRVREGSVGSDSSEPPKQQDGLLTVQYAAPVFKAVDFQTVHGSTTVTVSGGPNADVEESPVQLDTSEEHAAKLSKIRKVLLMRAYPTWFVILWIPGLANRLVEAAGNVPPDWLVVLQCGTSYIGFVNAITYGWNEGILKEVRRRGGWYRRTQKARQLEELGVRMQEAGKSPNIV